MLPYGCNAHQRPIPYISTESADEPKLHAETHLSAQKIYYRFIGIALNEMKSSSTFSCTHRRSHRSLPDAPSMLASRVSMPRAMAPMAVRRSNSMQSMPTSRTQQAHKCKNFSRRARSNPPAHCDDDLTLYRGRWRCSHPRGVILSENRAQRPSPLADDIARPTRASGLLQLLPTTPRAVPSTASSGCTKASLPQDMRAASGSPAASHFSRAALRVCARSRDAPQQDPRSPAAQNRLL